MSAQLPTGWLLSSLGEICISSGGGTPPKSDPIFWSGGTVPWVSPKDMKSRAIVSSEDQVTAAALSKLTLIPAESVLVVVRSGILSRTLPVAVSKCEVTINQDMRAFVPRKGIDADFVAWQLICNERDVLEKTSKDGTTVASIEGPALASYRLAIAPSAEQKRIVAKLDELLSDLDAGVAELKAAQQKLQRYRQSLLKAAVEGALTADWRAKNPPTETGAELLQRILRERRARWEEQQLAKFAAQGKAPPKGWKEKYPEPQLPKTEGLPELPEGWVWASVEQATTEALIGLDRGAEHQSKSGNGTLYLKMNNITLDGKILLDDVVRVDASAGEIQRFAALPGDILFNTRNSKELVGKAGLVQPHSKPLIFNNNLMRLRFFDNLMPRFAIATLCAPTFRSRMEGIKKATTSVAAVYARDLWPLAIAIPPHAEQKVICSFLEDQMQEIDKQDYLIRQMIGGLNAQRQNLLRAAFRGELVPQDPKDEPASVLLERLRAQRLAGTPQIRKRKSAKIEARG